LNGVASAASANLPVGRACCYDQGHFDPGTVPGTSKWEIPAYGFFTLLRFVEDPAKRKKAEKQFLYLMA
jgi:hypothetical protein